MRRLALALLVAALLVTAFTIADALLDPPAPIQCPADLYYEGTPCKT